MNEPIVIVVIPTHNMKEDLEVCLSSLHQQTYKKFKIIVIDDASEDGTEKMLQEKFPWVKVIFNQTKIGPEKARNIGIKSITTKYIATLDADTKVEESWLEELIKKIKSDENIGMCASKILKYFQPDIIDNIGHSLYYDFSPIHLGEGEKDGEKFNKTKEVFGPCLAGTVIKKEVFDKVGLFDEDYGQNFSDDEWTWRTKIAGYKCIYVPSARMYHKRLQSNKLNTRLLFLWERNRIWSLLKYYPVSMIFISFYYSLKRYIISIISYYRSNSYEKLPFYQIIFVISYAWYQALKKLLKFWKKSKTVSSIKKISKFQMNSWLNKNWNLLR